MWFEVYRSIESRLAIRDHFCKQICCIHLIFICSYLLVVPSIVQSPVIYSCLFLHNINVTLKNKFYYILFDNCDLEFNATSLRDF